MNANAKKAKLAKAAADNQSASELFASIMSLLVLFFLCVLCVFASFAFGCLQSVMLKGETDAASDGDAAALAAAL
jgi:hypothetical protein